MLIFKAYYESRHFDFETLALTEKDALKQMKNTLRAHSRQYGIPDNSWWNQDDIGIIAMELGKYYRDGSEIKGKTK